MSKIATYQVNDVPTVDDILIGTDKDDSDITKNFRLGDVLALGVGVPLVLYDGILYWDGDNNRYTPFAEKQDNPTEANFYLGTENPTLKSRLNLDAELYASSFYCVDEVSTLTTATYMTSSGLWTNRVDTGIDVANSAYVTLTDDYLHIYGICGTEIPHNLPIMIGYNGAWDEFHGEHLYLDDYNQSLNIAFTNIYLSKGTASKWLALDESKKIIFMDAPTASFTPTDQILDWSTDKYIPYAAKKGVNPSYPYFYTGSATPTFLNRLNLDGMLFATSLTAYSSVSYAIVGESTTTFGIYGKGQNLSGIFGESVTSYGVRAVTMASPSIYGESSYAGASSIENLMDIVRLSSSTPSAGIGGYTTYKIQSSTGVISAGRTSCKLSDVSASADAVFEWFLLNDGSFPTTPQMTLFPNGQVRLSAYGTGALGGTPTKWLAVDASGYIIEEEPPSGGVSPTPTDYTLDWNSGSNRYQPYAAKKGADPTYAYFYTGTEIPTFTNRINLDAFLYATKLHLDSSSGYVLDVSTVSGTAAVINSSLGLPLQLNTSAGNNNTMSPSIQHVRIEGSGANGIGVYEQYKISSSIGGEVETGRFACRLSDVTTGYEDGSFEWYLINSGTISATARMTLNSTGQLTLNEYGSGTFTGTATKWLAVDASGNIIEEHPPVGGGVEPKDDILYWDTDKYTPYAGKSTPDPSYAYFYSGADDPTFTNRLNLDGYLYVTSLIGNSGAYGYGVYGISENGYGVFGETVTGYGIFGNATTAAGGVGVIGTALGGVAMIAQCNPATTNTIHDVLYIHRVTSSTATAGIGGSLSYRLENGSGGLVDSGRFACSLTNVTNPNEDAKFEWYLVSGGSIPATAQMILSDTGALRLSGYGVGTFTGTPTKWLTVDVNGNIIEENAPVGGISPTDNILDWSTDKYMAYAAKKGADPSYAYLYSGTDNPTFTNRINLDGILYTSGLVGSSVDGFGLVAISQNSHGITTQSYAGYGILSQSENSAAIYASASYASVNTTSKIMGLQVLSEGTTEAGIGGYMSFHIPKASSVIIEAGKFECFLTDVGSATDAAFAWHLMTNGSYKANAQMTLSNTGALNLSQYGGGDFTGTATKWLAVDTDGNVIEEDVPAGTGLLLDPNTASYSGPTATFTAGENLLAGDLCYIYTNGRMKKADADAIATCLGVAIATAAITSGNSGVFLLMGFITGYSSLTIGGAIYASTTAGTMSQTAPTGTDDVVQIVGVASSATTIYFLPSLSTIELI